MREIFEKYNIKIDEKQQKLLENYRELLKTWNEAFNLTAITEDNEIAVKHFVDSLLWADEFAVDNSVIDVGCGAGFPSIPLKIFRPDLKITMLEATKKKCTFLETVVKELGLTDIEVVNGRAEELAIKKEYREKFDYGTARAVARLNTLCEYVLPFVKVGGSFVVYKGDAQDEIVEAANAIKVLGGRLKSTKNCELEGAKRTAVVIEKIKNTDLKYPRGRGKERSKPL